MSSVIVPRLSSIGQFVTEKSCAQGLKLRETTYNKKGHSKLRNTEYVN